MENTAAEGASQRLLRVCLAGEEPAEELLQESLRENGGRTFLRVVVERLGDLFEPRLCDVYARLFSRVLGSAELLARYERIRQARVCRVEPKRVYVLSRITIGADAAITSVLLDAARRRFPKARIVFLGPAKNGELFAADERIEVEEFAYPRSGSLAERVAAFRPIDDDGAIVVDSDSRITQLGLLPICDESRHFFFESRGYGDESSESLPQLAQRWARETFEVEASQCLALPSATDRADVAVSLGVGENSEKRIEGSFEAELLGVLMRRGDVIVDKGAGGEETARVEALARAVPGIRTYQGAYAPFAAIVANSGFYLGYDSAGQHVASAAGTPLLSVFAGYPCERFVERWHPKGTVIRVTDRARALEDVLQNLTL